jgi:hypothetical protein
MMRIIKNNIRKAKDKKNKQVKSKRNRNLPCRRTHVYHQNIWKLKKKWKCLSHGLLKTRND